jgi:hypothetical protein
MRQLFHCPGKSAIPRDPAKLRKEAFHPLPDGVGSNRVRLGNFVAGISIQLDLDQKIQLGVAEKPPRDTVVKEVPQQRVALHGVVIDQLRRDLEFFCFRGSVDRPLTTSPFKELPFYLAGNREDDVGLALLHMFRTQYLKKGT